MSKNFNKWTVYLAVIVLVTMLIENVLCQSNCNVFINKKSYRADKRLYTSKVYEIEYGLDMELPSSHINPPIGYSIDVDCKNQSKLKAHYLFDLSDIPIEVNLNNCTKNGGFVHVLEFDDKKKPPNKTAVVPTNYLKFVADFKNAKHQQLDSADVKLSLNRRLGKGCSIGLTFVKYDQQSTSIFEYDYYDQTGFWAKFKQVVFHYVDVVSSPPIVLAVLFILFVTLTVMVLLVIALRKKSNLTFGNNFIKLTNLTNHGAESSGNESGTKPAQIQNIYGESSSPNMEEDGRTQEARISSKQTQAPGKVDDCRDQSGLNEFQVLRKQLIDKLNNRDHSDRNYGQQSAHSLDKNLIFKN